MKKKFYITSAITYTSGKPHIGNTYEVVLCDCLARFKRYQGYNVYFQTGTDEHGQKIEEKANNANIAPQIYVDKVASEIQKLWEMVGVSYNNFIRTTSDIHKTQVQKIFLKLYNQGDIYKGSYEGWYCTPCESFWTDSQLIDGCCPDCGRAVSKMREDAYFFRMSKYANRLQDYYRENPSFILPQSRKNEMINNFLKPGLQDLCVSRSSFKWGIPITFDPTHIVYVWLDALTNYITGIGYDVDGIHDDMFKKLWPADVHIIGKDIVRFHAIYWPIFLMALDIPLPKKIYGHGWLLQDGGKMSKSKGNVMYVDDLINLFGQDVIRYYVLSKMPYENDGLITYDSIIETTNTDLANIIGNLINRTIAMSNKYFDGYIRNTNKSAPVDDDMKEFVLNSAKSFVEKMDEFRVAEAINEAVGIFKRANKYIDETTPWSLAKEADKKTRLETILYNLVEAANIGLSLLQVIMPCSCQKAANFLGCSLREYNNLFNFNIIKSTHVSSDAVPLFLRINKESLKIE